MGTKGDSNRTRIVAAADQLFYQRGYNQTSFSDIADATGIPRGNFYYYFKTKDDILAAVIDERVRYFHAMLARIDAEYDEPRDRLLAFANHIAESGPTVVESGCPIGSLCTELTKDSAELQSKSREVFVVLREWISSQFAQMEFRDCDDRAMDMLARMQGGSVIASTFNDENYLYRCLSELKDWLNNMTLS